MKCAPMISYRQPSAVGAGSVGSHSATVKEVEELSSKYKDRIISGTSVKEFNSIVNQILVCSFQL